MQTISYHLLQLFSGLTELPKGVGSFGFWQHLQAITDGRWLSALQSQLQMMPPAEQHPDPEAIAGPAHPIRGHERRRFPPSLSPDRPINPAASRESRVETSAAAAACHYDPVQPPGRGLTTTHSSPFWQRPTRCCSTQSEELFCTTHAAAEQ